MPNVCFFIFYSEKEAGGVNMRIGQLTFHAAHNYGSVLQAYALSRQLQLMGHDTEFINLRPAAQKKAYQIINGRGIHRAFHYLIYSVLKKRFRNFERFITQVLPVTAKEYVSTEELKEESFHYDAYVCGGDQIWNPVCQDFETAYYLQFLSKEDSAKKISYSPSLGKTEFDKETLQKINEWVQIFDFISVREPRGADIIQRLTGRRVQTVCDPVILLDKSEWIKMAVKPKYNKPYILVYFLENNHGSRELTEYLRRITGYDVVIFNEYIRDFVKPYHKAYGASPEEFVGLFMNADFIYTNSFHGTAFSTIFEKPFISSIAIDQEHTVNNNDSRKIDYLKRIGLEDRLYTKGQPSKEFLLNMDYTQARKKIKRFREESMEYLVRALE